MKEFTMKTVTRLLAATTIALSMSSAFAQSDPIDGEVRNIDQAAGKITLKHGAAKSLGMDEPMTMVYRVKDPALLKQVRVGDKVQFEVDTSAGYTVTKIQKK